jgi:peptide/nickel transport system permease protein
MAPHLRTALRLLTTQPKASVGASILVVFLAMALVGPWLVGDPQAFLAVPHASPSWAHLLGTTGQGQDVFAQTVVGARVTLGVALLSGLGVVGIGALVGGAAGYTGGRVDDLLTLLINVFLLLPGLPLMVVLAAWLPSGPATMTAVLVVTGWAWNARVLRAQVLSLRSRDYVSAARVSGEASWRIVLFEILPNMAGLLVSSFIGATVYALGAQVGLEFLGLGDLSRVTWGTNLYWASNDAALITGAWWTFVPTGACIAGVAFALSLLNFGIDEISNPRLAIRGLNPGEGPQATPVLRET